MPTGVLVGVDLGGTRVRVVGSDDSGTWSRRLNARAPALADLPRFLRRLWRQWGLSPRDVAALVVATKGVWTAGERKGQERRLRALARRVRVISDAEAAFLGALGDRPGVLILSGTGSIVLGRNRRGRWQRAGGLGPLLGDEGSAFWIGREWLRLSARGGNLARALKFARSPDNIARIAALAPLVLRRAARGDLAARELVTGSQNILASLACAVAEDLRLPPPVLLSWAGSLMDNRTFRAGVLRSLHRQGLRVRAVAPAEPAVKAAHAMAKRLAHRTRS